MGRKKRIRNDNGQLEMVPAESKKEVKRSGKATIISAKAELKTAKGYARKWLVLLIVVCLICYFVFSTGGGGALELIKGLIP